MLGDVITINRQILECNCSRSDIEYLNITLSINIFYGYRPIIAINGYAAVYSIKTICCISNIYFKVLQQGDSLGGAVLGRVDGSLKGVEILIANLGNGVGLVRAINLAVVCLEFEFGSIYFFYSRACNGDSRLSTVCTTTDNFINSSVVYNINLICTRTVERNGANSGAIDSDIVLALAALSIVVVSVRGVSHDSVVLSSGKRNGVLTRHIAIKNNRNDVLRTIVGEVAANHGKAGFFILRIDVNATPAVVMGNQVISSHGRSVVNKYAVAIVVVAGHIGEIQVLDITPSLNAATGNSTAVNLKITDSNVIGLNEENMLAIRAGSSCLNLVIAGRAINCYTILSYGVSTGGVAILQVEFNIPQECNNYIRIIALIGCCYSLTKRVIMRRTDGSLMIAAVATGAIVGRIRSQRTYCSQRKDQAHSKQHCQNALFHTDSPFHIFLQMEITS
ncbi:MAG TPA: hypothetical protein IAD33_02180 [Candidatus Scatomorpha gallistercoris]|nr:hypothetical protein [Candidatus Scatomorpha gallistercoris]